MRLSAPPLLKTTIIQLNKDIDPEDNNYEILTNGYNDGLKGVVSVPFSTEEAPRKKRRRSSSFVDDEELAKRRTETKQLHSVIEKRRRVKINREFEALKYLIPACRSSTDPSSKRLLGTNTTSKIDGMYKLTILKAAVEYMLYLHHVVREQHNALEKVLDTYNYDVGFCNVTLDVNQYRNIDQEFNFSDLPTAAPMTGTMSQKSQCGLISEDYEGEVKPRLLRAKSDTATLMPHRSSLPTPDVTPDIVPTFSYLSDRDLQQAAHASIITRPFLFESRGRGSISTNTSPFTVPIKTQIKASFQLPDPALSSAPAASSTQSGPKKMFFRSKAPSQNFIITLRDIPLRRSDGTNSRGAGVDVDIDDADGGEEAATNDGSRVEDATRALLNLRAPSIDNLLN